MAVSFSFLLEAVPRDVSVKEALSGIFGSISLATWIFLLLPQLWLNYKTRSADGISLAFLGVWLVGDVTNLAGAVWAGLVPTVIALAIYFCFADFVLIGQCLYYNHINAKIAARQALNPPLESEAESSDPTQPLLQRRRTSSIGLPGSQRRRSSAPSSGSGGQAPISQILEAREEEGSRAWKKNTLSVFLVCIAGAAGWAIAWQSGVWTPTPEESQIPDFGSASEGAVGAQVLGYFSAVCYLGARIPQILKNYQEKSCDGLALLFFVLSLMGNATYGAGILFHSLERDYVMTNLPWLIGSLGTIVEDGVIFMQFRMYKERVNAVV